MIIEISFFVWFSFEFLLILILTFFLPAQINAHSDGVFELHLLFMAVALSLLV